MRVLLIALLAAISYAQTEEIFGHYFDIPAGSGNGTFVTGRLQPRANMRVFKHGALTGWSFHLQRMSPVFELVNQNDTKGRIFAALRVKELQVVGSIGTLYNLSVELRNGDIVVGSRHIEIHSVGRTVLSMVQERVKKDIRGNGRTWGRFSPDDAQLIALIEDIEMNDGALTKNCDGCEEFYTMTPQQKASEPTVKDKWENAVKHVGGTFAKPIEDHPISADLTAERFKLALYSAFIKLAEISPIDARDFHDNQTHFESRIDNSCGQKSCNRWLRDIPAAGYADTTGTGLQNGMDHSVVTHQWSHSDALIYASVEMADTMYREMMYESSELAQKAFDAMHRLSSTAWALTPTRLTLGSETERWGNLLDTNHVAGAWNDANQGHRSRMWMGMLVMCQDYNRPITYIPYWYDDFDFLEYDFLWEMDSENRAADQAIYSAKPEFSIRPGFSPSGVFSDFQNLILHSFPKKKLYDLSGFQPDGFINHHHGGCPDTAMNAYGFEWLSDMIESAKLLRNTPWEVTSPVFADLPARVLTYTYPRIMYKGHLDHAFAGRSYMGEKYSSWRERNFNPVLHDFRTYLSSLLPYELQDAVNRTDDGDHVTNGCTAFWNSDSMVMRSETEGGQSWYSSLRMRSLYSHGNEDFEKIPKSWHMGSGYLQVRVVGDEYDQIRATMDWHVLSGVTEEWRNDTMPKKGKPLRCGGNQFAVTVTDGLTGLAAFEYSQHPGPSNEDWAQEYSTVRANKAYFFLPWGVLALGNSIERADGEDGSPRKGQGHPVVTTVDQTLWRSDVTLRVGGGTSKVLPFSEGDCNETIWIPATELAWVHQGEKGYFIKAPHDEDLQVELRCNSTIAATDPDKARDISWGDTERWQVENSDMPFLLVIHHGVHPENASYRYAIVPGISASDMFSLEESMELALGEGILYNDGNIQAIKSSSIIYAAVRSASDASLPVNNTNVTFSVNHPCAFMLEITASEWKLSAAEATRNPNAAELTISMDAQHLLLEGTYEYNLTGMTALKAQESVEVRMIDSSTKISVGIVKSSDEEYYNYQEEMYLGASIHVSLRTRQLGIPTSEPTTRQPTLNPTATPTRELVNLALALQPDDIVVSSERAKLTKEFLIDGVTQITTTPKNRDYWHTRNGDTHPKAELNLKAESQISEVKVWNRCDCCDRHLTGFKVYADDYLCGTIARTGLCEAATIDCGNRVATKITVEKEGVRGTIVEIEVFGFVADSYAEESAASEGSKTSSLKLLLIVAGSSCCLLIFMVLMVHICRKKHVDDVHEPEFTDSIRGNTIKQFSSVNLKSESIIESDNSRETKIAVEMEVKSQKRAMSSL